MLDDLDWFDFFLAKELGMTVDEMNERLSNQEYLKWRAYYNYKHTLEDLKNGAN